MVWFMVAKSRIRLSDRTELKYRLCHSIRIMAVCTKVFPNLKTSAENINRLLGPAHVLVFFSINNSLLLMVSVDLSSLSCFDL